MIPDLDFSCVTSSEGYRHEDFVRIQRQISDACQLYGFFSLYNHGISQSLLDRVFQHSINYFNQATEDKLDALNKDGGGGYVPIGLERLDLQSTAVERKEAFNIRFQTDAPKLPPAMQSDIEEFRCQLDLLASRIFKLLARSLAIDPHRFTEAHQSSQPSGTTLRLLHYLPAQRSNDGETTIRAGRHSDYGSLTLLFQRSIGGLEVVDPQSYLSIDYERKDINWNASEVRYIKVPAVENRVIVNIGDLMQVWTGGHFHSAQHRVVDRYESDIAGDRYSIAYFIHPLDNLVIKPLDIKPQIQAVDDELMRRRKKIELNRMSALLDGLNHPFTAIQYLDHRLGRSYHYS